MSVRILARVTAIAVALVAPQAAFAAAPSVADALKLAPVQAGIEFDNPSADEAKACKISAEKINGATAWVVRGSDAAILRQFSDSNNDNVVDTWSYYRGGLEIYRDADLNFNGKADQYRWFHTAGSRWGVDSNEDGKLDAWKSISAEEAAEEAIAAARTKDAARFARLLLSKDDAAKLGLPQPLDEKLVTRLGAAPKTFAKLVADGAIDAKGEFTDFGGLRPGAVPAGTRGITKDLLVYEDVWAMVLTGGEHKQLQLGSMINVDGCWKLIDGPVFGAGDAVIAGFFYDVEGVAPSEQPQVAEMNEPTAEMQKILSEIEKVDVDLAAAAADKKPALNAQRADLLQKLAAAAATPEEREQWTKQLADMISFAAQEGSFPNGVARLSNLKATLEEQEAGDDLLTHIEFRRMQAEWGQSLADPKADYAKVQEAWLKQLEGFVDEHKASEHVAEALLQLAMASEFAGNNEAAQKWYERLVADFAKNPSAAKARGAIRRLKSAGQPFALKGADVRGGGVDLNQYRGKAVLVHYWSTSSPTCKADHDMLADLFKKYGGAKFDVIGVSLDYSQDELTAYLRANPQLRWKQLFEPGGFESRLANEMGVITSPLMVLVDDKGQVANANVQPAELEDELKKLLDGRVANAK